MLSLMPRPSSVGTYGYLTDNNLQKNGYKAMLDSRSLIPRPSSVGTDGYLTDDNLHCGWLDLGPNCIDIRQTGKTLSNDIIEPCTGVQV